VTSTQPAERIVVGIDGSDSSKAALRWAGFLAQTLHCEIHAVSAWQVSTTWTGAAMAMPPADWDPADTAAATLRDTVAEVFGDHPPVSVTAVVREGGAAHVLLETSTDARMLVVGSRGHGGFAGLLLGSVSTACAEHATCPVLVLHGSSTPPQQA
jgi:nucleotide-binding universal stress UspA family protein